MRITLDFNLTDPENGPVLDDSLPNSVHEYVSRISLKCKIPTCEYFSVTSKLCFFTTLHWSQRKNNQLEERKKRQAGFIPGQEWRKRELLL